MNANIQKERLISNAAHSQTCHCGKALRLVRDIPGFDWSENGTAFCAYGGSREITKSIVRANRHDVVRLVRYGDVVVEKERYEGKCRG